MAVPMGGPCGARKPAEGRVEAAVNHVPEVASSGHAPPSERRIRSVTISPRLLMQPLIASQNVPAFLYTHPCVKFF